MAHIYTGVAAFGYAGGNTECLPNSAGGPRYYFYGTKPFGGIESQFTFFEAQDVNPPLCVDTDWMAVGHVDELVSLASDGQHIAVADPEMALGLLLRVNQVDNVNPVMCQGMSQDYSISAGDHTVSSVLGAFEDYNLNTVMDPDNLPSIIKTVTEKTGATFNDWGVTSPNYALGSEPLAKGMAFTAELTQKRYFKIVMTSSTTYDVYYRNENDAPDDWSKKDPSAGNINQDRVFPQAKAFILSSWWSGTPAYGDTFCFSADPTTDIVELPVLYGPTYYGALAYTSNCVNSLVNGNTIVVPDLYGPVVNGTDILKDYTTRAFQKCGYTDIVFADARYYHNLAGEVHCATNAIRDLPPGVLTGEEHWWQP